VGTKRERLFGAKARALMIETIVAIEVDERFRPSKYNRGASSILRVLLGQDRLISGPHASECEGFGDLLVESEERGA
jgi:hypothetical protein